MLRWPVKAYGTFQGSHESLGAVVVTTLLNLLSSPSSSREDCSCFSCGQPQLTALIDVMRALHRQTPHEHLSKVTGRQWASSSSSAITLGPTVAGGEQTGASEQSGFFDFQTMGMLLPSNPTT